MGEKSYELVCATCKRSMMNVRLIGDAKVTKQGFIVECGKCRAVNVVRGDMQVFQEMEWTGMTEVDDGSDAKS